MKKFLALLLVLSMLLPYAVFGAEKESPLISDADYEAVNAMWQELYGAEKRSQSDPENAQSVAQKVTDNELYIDGTLRWNGEDQFTFETTVGVTCGYSARLRAIGRNAKRDEAAMQEPEIQTVSYATRSNSALDVYLIEPYYGIDSDFSKQYQSEAISLVQTTGGTYHLYSREAATIDAVADAIEEGAVVIFDSHGETDYAVGDDYTTGATTSYILLQTGEGLTAADYAPDGDTYHAIDYGYVGDGMYCYAVDGTCIANHMDKDAPNSLLWMAICLGMATDGMHAPLREKGVEVAYGYSQSVTFEFDYLWEEVFFAELKKGETVAAAIKEMKTKVGNWDLCDEYYTIALARRFDCAFPIVVSSEDVYPGHGMVDTLQLVKSEWTLSQAGMTDEEPTEPTEGSTEPTEESTEPTEVSTEPTEESTEPTEVSTEPTEESTEPTEESTEPTEETTEPTEEPTEPSEDPTEELLEYQGFEDVKADSWYYDNVVFAYTHGLMKGVSDTKFDPNGKVTRAMLVTILYRNEKEPSIDGMSNPFKDVKADEWYTEAIIWAAKQGIVNGMSQTTFEPNTAITREQVAAILHRYAGFKNMDVSQYELDGYSDFPDVGSVSAYAVEPMKWAVGVKIIGGMDGKLAPRQTATRAQIAAMLQRYLSLGNSE